MILTTLLINFDFRCMRLIFNSCLRNTHRLSKSIIEKKKLTKLFYILCGILNTLFYIQHY
jgi:hypothetical protein